MCSAVRNRHHRCACREKDLCVSWKNTGEFPVSLLVRRSGSCWSLSIIKTVDCGLQVADQYRSNDQQLCVSDAEAQKGAPEFAGSFRMRLVGHSVKWV